MLWWTIRQIKSKNPETRMRAAKKLGALSQLEVVEPLLTALKDENSDVQKVAAEALENMFNEALVARLNPFRIAKANSYPLFRARAFARWQQATCA